MSGHLILKEIIFFLSNDSTKDGKAIGYLVFKNVRRHNNFCKYVVLEGMRRDLREIEKMSEWYEWMKGLGLWLMGLYRRVMGFQRLQNTISSTSLDLRRTVTDLFLHKFCNGNILCNKSFLYVTTLFFSAQFLTKSQQQLLFLWCPSICI